ncbi:MAG: TIR domain-containing protein [Endomicrobium sp.]|jgi:hypothetical protein|nr:TIR domain-containing protein [Endomicrobium sp.]
MVKRRVFFSFDYDNDVMRVSQIKQMGVIEDGSTLVSSNDWEKIKRGGYTAIKKWINDNMNGRSCIVVLIGTDTAESKWVKYEIEKAWNDGKGVLGIYIHNIKCARHGYCPIGNNPFDFTYNGQNLSSYVECFNPKDYDAYNDITNNLENWIERAIAKRR